MCNLLPIELILNTEKACFVLYIDKETNWLRLGVRKQHNFYKSPRKLATPVNAL